MSLQNGKSLSEDCLGEEGSPIFLSDHPTDGARRKIGTVACAIAFIAVTQLAFISPALRAEEPPDGVWGKAIMSQPLDKSPVREVKIPAWLEEITRYAYLSATHYEEAAGCGVQMGELVFGDGRGVYYDSKLLRRVPEIPEDHVAKQIAQYKKFKMRIIGAIPPWLQVQMYEAHPDWRMIGSNTIQIPEMDLAANIEGGALCQMGPWGDFLIEVLTEILAKYPQIDGFGFDGIHHFGPCYCQHCREAYRKEIGQEIPNADMNDAAYRRYVLWEDRRMETFIERMQRRLKAINPDCAVVTWTTNAGRFGHFKDIPHNMSARMNLLFDAPAQEFWLDETNRGNTVVPAFSNAYIWAVTNHRVAFSEPYLMSHGNPYGVDSYPEHEMLRRMLLPPTYGVNPSLSTGWPDLREAAYRAIKEVQRRSPWMTHKQPEPWAALVMSDATRNFYGRDPAKIEERYLANVLGTFRVGIEEHLPITVINDWNLNPEDLARYKLLILANDACLSDQQASTIREFVENGGGLVASVDTSLFDELGNARKDFALADVLGVHYQGAPSSQKNTREKLDINFDKGIAADYWEKHKNILDFKMGLHPLFDLDRLKVYLGERPVTFKGQAVLVETLRPTAKVVGTITLREQGGIASPAVVTGNYGKGKVVYLAAGFDSAYYLYPYPYQRLVLAQAMRWAAAEPVAIQVEAPMCVHSTFFRQTKDGERLVVHLYNDLNSTGNHAKPDEDVPLREEVVPIHDIKVTFKDYNIGRVHLEPEGIDLKITETDGGKQVTVPALAIHSMVVAELP